MFMLVLFGRDVSSRCDARLPSIVLLSGPVAEPVFASSVIMCLGFPSASLGITVVSVHM